MKVVMVLFVVAQVLETHVLVITTFAISHCSCDQGHSRPITYNIRPPHRS
jgi:hypothetical protein